MQNKTKQTQTKTTTTAYKKHTAHTHTHAQIKPQKLPDLLRTKSEFGRGSCPLPLSIHLPLHHPPPPILPSTLVMQDKPQNSLKVLAQDSQG